MIPVISKLEMCALVGSVEALVVKALKCSRTEALQKAKKMGATHIAMEEDDAGGIMYVPILHDPDWASKQEAT